MLINFRYTYAGFLLQPLLVMLFNGGYIVSNFNEQKFCCFYSKEAFLSLPPQPILLVFLLFFFSSKLRKVA